MQKDLRQFKDQAKQYLNIEHVPSPNSGGSPTASREEQSSATRSRKQLLALKIAGGSIKLHQKNSDSKNTEPTSEAPCYVAPGSKADDSGQLIMNTLYDSQIIPDKLL